MPIQPNQSSQRPQQAAARQASFEAARPTLAIGDISFANGAQVCDRPDELRVRIDAQNASGQTVWCNAYIGERLVINSSSRVDRNGTVAIALRQPTTLQIPDRHYVNVLAGFGNAAAVPIAGRQAQPPNPDATGQLQVAPQNPYAGSFYSMTDQLGAVIRNSLHRITVNGGDVQRAIGTFRSRDMDLSAVNNIAFSMSVILTMHARAEFAFALSDALQLQWKDFWRDGVGRHVFPELEAIPPGNSEYGPVQGIPPPYPDCFLLRSWSRAGLADAFLNPTARVDEINQFVRQRVVNLTPCEALFSDRCARWFSAELRYLTQTCVFANLVAFGKPAALPAFGPKGSPTRDRRPSLGGPAVSGRIESVGKIVTKALPGFGAREFSGSDW